MRKYKGAQSRPSHSRKRSFGKTKPNFRSLVKQEKDDFLNIHGSRLKIEDPASASRIERQNEVVSDIFEDIQDRISEFSLRRPLGDLDEYIDSILSPGVERAREMIAPETIAPQTGTTAQGPQVSLPTQITGTPVASNVLSNQQNLGQRFNLTAQLSPEEKTQFLFGNRIV